MHSEATVQDRERTQNQTNKDLDVFNLQKGNFLILEGLSLGKRPITVFCGLKWVELKSTGQRNFSSIKGRTSLAWLFKDRIGSLRRQSPNSCKG